MARIYRTTDRIKYKIGDLEIEVSPLDVHDKSILHSYIAKGQQGDLESLVKGSAQAIKMGVKSVKGLEDADGNPYEVQFEPNNKYLTDECVADLMNIQESNSMVTLCAQLIAGVPSQLPRGVSVQEDKKNPNERKAKK